MTLVQLCFQAKISKCFLFWICSVFSYDLDQVSNVTFTMPTAVLIG